MTNTTTDYARELLAMLDSSQQSRASAVLDVAKLMRERAQAATRTGWQAGEPSWAGANAVLTDEGHPITVCGDGESAAADARHIASIANPVVALRLADWLEAMSNIISGGLARDIHHNSAVALCRAYLAAHIGTE